MTLQLDTVAVNLAVQADLHAGGKVLHRGGLSLRWCFNPLFMVSSQGTNIATGTTYGSQDGECDSTNCGSFRRCQEVCESLSNCHGFAFLVDSGATNPCWLKTNPDPDTLKKDTNNWAFALNSRQDFPAHCDIPMFG